MTVGEVELLAAQLFHAERRDGGWASLAYVERRRYRQLAHELLLEAENDARNGIGQS